MIKMFTACTYEADDAQYAIEEIKSMLDLENNALSNSVGIITCHPDFVDTGVVKAISESMPFDVIGMTTIASLACGEKSEITLTMFVLTSDDVSFRTMCTDSLEGADNKATAMEIVSRAYDATAKGDKPDFIFVLEPLLSALDADTFTQCIDELSDGTPIYGSVAFDITSDYSRACTFYNGVHSKNSSVAVFFYGDIEVDFYVQAITEGDAQKYVSIITKSDGRVLKEVNNMPLLDYFESIGITKDKSTAGLPAIPFMLDYNDGSKPVAHAIYSITPEGYAVCGGNMPVNASLAIGSINTTVIVETAQSIINQILNEDKSKNVIMFPCGSRYIVLGAKRESEMNVVLDALDGKYEYFLAYSGGEICPVKGADGKYVNRFHNFTFTACVIK